MKIDRRSFLAFSVGGAAGTALSPLPWKLTDDSSIWSQMWPWVPVPPDGKIEYAHSTCLLCPGGCGITVRKIDGRPVKIEGREGHPVNQGGICILGAAGLQVLYGPSRVKTPLKRVGARGEGHWAPISWEAALTELAEKLGALRAEGHPEKLSCISGTETGTVPALLKRFLTAYGSPNFIGPVSAQTAHNAAMAVMAGSDSRVAFDVGKADFILSFGSDLLDGWGSPAQMFHTYGSRKERQAEIVQIDYRLSNTAAKADRFISINPGTEGALAMGVIHKILADATYNQSFVNQFVAGFEPFKQKVMADFTPAKVADITAVPAETIAEIAMKFTAARRPLALCGRGQGSAPGALGDTTAVMALNALVGNLNAEGGIHLLPSEGYITWSDPKMDDIASKGITQKRVDGAGAGDFFMRSMPHRVFLTEKTEQDKPIELLLLADANPLYTYRDTKAVKAVIEQIPFIASFSSFMDETAQQADLILPNHIYLERFQDVSPPAGATGPYVGLARPVVAPQYNTQHLGDVIIALADRLKGTVADTFQWENYEACLKETLDWKWEVMNQDGFWTDSHYVPPAWDTMFQTASRRFEVSSDKFDSSWKETAPEGDSGNFPLLLMPYDSIRLASGSVGNPPFVTKTVADTVLKKDDLFVEINPETAHEYGLKEGSNVMLATPRGEAEVRTHLFDGIRPGIVAMPTGLGHTAFDDFLAGKGININELMGPVEDAATGFDAAWGIRVKLAKV